MGRFVNQGLVWHFAPGNFNGCGSIIVLAHGQRYSAFTGQEEDTGVYALKTRAWLRKPAGRHGAAVKAFSHDLWKVDLKMFLRFV